MRITTTQPDLRSFDPAADRPRRGPAGMRLTRTPAAALALAAACMLAAPCRADLDVTLSNSNITATAGSSGTFEVWLTNTGPSSVNVGADSFELTLSGSGAVSFTGASTATSLQTYIYTQSLDNNNGFPFTFNTFPNTDFTASDSWDNVSSPGGYATLASGATVGLGLVDFSVNAAASGVYTVGFGPAGTSLTDPSATPLTINSETGGTITIAGVTPTPELPTSVMWMFTAAAGSAVLWSRRRAAGTGE